MSNERHLGDDGNRLLFRVSRDRLALPCRRVKAYYRVGWLLSTKNGKVTVEVALNCLVAACSQVH